GNDLVRVHGMGGIGKSLLAEEYALRFGAAYPGGIFWLSASPPDTRTTPEQQYQGQMLDLAQQLGMEIKGQELPAIEGALRRRLEGVGSYLWVVDDLPAGAKAELLHRWRAPSAQGKTLVTSRSGGLSGNGKPIALEQLDDEAAFDLLTSRRQPKTDAERAAARDILRLLGNHALAVDVTGAAVQEMGFGPMLALLQNPGQDALDLVVDLADELPNGHEPAVAATLLHSIQHLPPKALTVLKIASLLAVEPIPRAFIAAVLGVLVGADEPDPVTSATAIKAATGEGLLERVDDDNIAAHILVSRTIRFHRPAAGGLRQAVMGAMIGVMCDATEIQHHRRLTPLLPHALALVNGAEDIEAATLLGCVGWLERTRGYYSSAASLFQSEWRIRSKLQGEHHVDTLTSMSNIGLSVFNQGKLSNARAIQEMELELCRKACGIIDERTLISANNLAETLRAQGDFAAAKALQEATLTILEHTLGSENQFTLTVMGNLAGTLWLQGNLDDALKTYESVLKIQNAIFDNKDYVDIMRSMLNIANIHCGKGNFNQARVLYEKVLSVWIRDFGEEHPFTLSCFNGLAEALRFMGELDKSLALHRAILPIRVRRQGVGHPETIDSMCNLACALWQSDKKEEAISLQKDALDLASNVLGMSHKRTQQFASILHQMQSAGPSS
ncbi:tetratricopeptide repeat protein, partial [Asticcacaulis sp.]|uniref:tetratricopeptide repeat protein n=1 Tax=Asticcacaulis sp. TaxID=1872648 RepID=UPI0026039D2C